MSFSSSLPERRPCRASDVAGEADTACVRTHHVAGQATSTAGRVRVCAIARPRIGPWEKRRRHPANHCTSRSSRHRYRYTGRPRFTTGRIAPVSGSGSTQRYRVGLSRNTSTEPSAVVSRKSAPPGRVRTGPAARHRPRKCSFRRPCRRAGPSPFPPSGRRRGRPAASRPGRRWSWPACRCHTSTRLGSWVLLALKGSV